MIIGLTGFARAGKDEAARGLADYKRIAFADELKFELNWTVKTLYNINTLNMSPEEKTLVRPMLVAHGAIRRAQNEDYWINKLAAATDCVGLSDAGHKFVLTDVRYPNEAAWVRDHGGKVVLITRHGVDAANSEERESIGTIIDKHWYNGVVCNNGTVEQLHSMIRSLISEEGWG